MRRFTSRLASLRVLLALTLLALPWGVARAQDPEPEELDPWVGYVVPNFAYDTDDGLGFGARGELNRRSPGVSPYEAAWVVHLYSSLRGFHHHRFRYDRLSLGPDGRLRLTVHLAWRQWTNDGYWGLGPGAPREHAYLGPFEDDDPRRKRYRYTLIQPFSNATLRVGLSGPWQLYGTLNLRYSVIRTYPGSLLEEDQPYGMDGGFTAQVSAGVLYDTRAPEIDPQGGLLWEVSGRWAPPLPGGAGSFGGPLVQLRVFEQLHPRVVLASRLMAEMLWGELPFYEMVHWGGFTPVAGFGGSDAARGINFGRYHSPGKALLNTELRVDTLHHTVLHKPMRWLVVPFVDLGLSFGAEPVDDALPRGSALVPAAGLGLRAVYAGSFIGRVDCAVSADPILSEQGEIVRGNNVGFYVTFDHLF